MSRQDRNPNKIQILERYKAGESAIDLAKEYGINRHTIYNWACDSSFSRRAAMARGEYVPYSQRKETAFFEECIDVETQIIMRNYEAGMDVTDIVKLTHIRRSQVTRTIKEAKAAGRWKKKKPQESSTRPEISKDGSA